ncbi:MAG: response regulator transcription factor [Caldilineaceae bacterium]|nr:response regulator transcription factor [Caldilineaceae bacterium]
MQQRILVIDDEVALRTTVQAYLEREGFAVQAVMDGPAALSAARSFRPSLVILDVMLPGMNGLDVLRELRRDSDVYVLMLTAKAGEIDKVLGLEMGADDYLTKPFSPRELVSRVKAILRRGRESSATESPLTFGTLRLDADARRVWKEDVEVELTSTEYELLHILARNAGTVLSRSQIIENVWGYDYFGDERVIDVHIRRIRRKIEDDPDNPAIIVTVRGAGYRFDGERS